MCLLHGLLPQAISCWLWQAYFILFGVIRWQISARVPLPLLARFLPDLPYSGALWGKPTWGTYWVWDARLTSMLVLFFFFIGYMALAGGFEDRRRGARPAAILALVGAVNLPIVKFSVDWWNTSPASKYFTQRRRVY